MESYPETIPYIYYKIRNRISEPMMYAGIMSIIIFFLSHTINISTTMTIIVIAIGVIYFINEYRNHITKEFNNRLGNIAQRSKNYRQILAHKVRQLEHKYTIEMQDLKQKCRSKSIPLLHAYNPSSMDESMFHIDDDPTDL